MPDDENTLVPAAMVEARAVVVVSTATDNHIPAIITEAGQQALLSFINFVTGEIENPNTRQAYLTAWREFGKWAEKKGVRLHQVQPFMLAEYREELKKRYHVRSVKQHLSALKRVFDDLVIHQVIPLNPAASVKGPKFSAQRGVTPVLSDEEIRRLVNSIDVTGGEDGKDKGRLMALRDRAIIATMVYSVGRVSAVAGMQVRDFFPQGRQWRVRFHEKGGKLHIVPAHHNLVEWLSEYIEAAKIGEEKTTPLFRSIPGKTNRITESAMRREDMYRMVKKRAAQAGVNVDGICCHTFRATGITLYMQNKGTLDEAQKLANHADPRTTKLYDRSSDTVSLDEVEKIRF
jgi:integrase